MKRKMSLDSKIKIGNYLNSQFGEIEVDAKEFLECYIDSVYSRQTKYLIEEEKKRIEKMETEHEDELQELEKRFDSLRETIISYKKILKEKGIKYR